MREEALTEAIVMAEDAEDSLEEAVTSPKAKREN
jgi:hypothetical protein